MPSSPLFASLAASSISTPINRSGLHTFARVLDWCSPTPPVNTMMSTPPISAANAPTYLVMRCSYISSERMAFSLPCLAAAVISRISEDTPLTPVKPLSLFTILSISLLLRLCLSIKKISAPGSTSPQRVPIIRPSVGVKPILVSMLLPSFTAVMLPPLPTWQVMIFLPFGSTPRNSHTRCDT